MQRVSRKRKASSTQRLKLYHSQAPLTFVMQLDLESLATVGTVDPGLPREGRLLVFYDMIVRPGSRETIRNARFSKSSMT